MKNKLFVGGLPWSTTSEEVQRLFSEVGTVVSGEVAADRETGRSKGFAFVEMQTAEEAQQAIERFDGTELGGRRIAVSIALPKGERPQRRESRDDRNRSPRF